MSTFWMINRRTTLGIVLAILLLVVTAILSYDTLRSLRTDSRWVELAEHTLEELSNAQSLLATAESRVRGYIVTGQPSYVEQQSQRFQKIGSYLNDLDSLVQQHPRQVSLLQILRPLVQNRIELLEKTVNAYRLEGPDAALAIVRTDRGKLLIDSIASIIDSVRAEERLLLTEQRNMSNSRASQTIIALVAGSALVLIILAVIVFLLNRQFRARRIAEAGLRESETRFLHFLEHVPAGIFILNADGSSYFANETAQHILGKGIVPGLSAVKLTESYRAYRAGTDSIYPGNELPIVRALKGVHSTVSDIEVERPDGRIPLLVTGAPIYDEEQNLRYAMAAFVDISTQKEVERRLEESERRYRQIINRANDIIYRTDKNGYFQFVNEIGLRIFEYSMDELRSMRFIDIIRPDARGHVRRFYLRQSAERKENTYHEFPAVTNTGKQIYLGQNVTLLVEGDTIHGFQAVARDITETRDAQERLRRREHQLATVIDTVDEGITLSDEHGIFEIFNPRMEALTGFTKREANATSDFSKLIASDPQEHQRGLDRLKVVLEKGFVRDIESTIRSKDGTLKTVLVSTSLIRQGARSMFLSVYRDISEQKEYLRKLEEATRAANAAAKAKAEFLATMSHEIRTPMNGVIGMTDVLLHSELSPDQYEYVDTIRTSGETLLTIINDILDFSKIESGKLLLDERPFDLTTCIEDVYDLLSFKAKEKNLDLLYLIDPAIPRMIEGDDVRLRQILLNLTGNAVKFTPSGEVFTKITLQESLADAIVLQFDIKDTGIGIPEDAQQQLFQAFTQADSSTTRKFGGTGLGLAISQRLVALMGGEISLASTVGKGSTFSFTIQSKRVDDQGVAPRLYIRSKSEPLSGKHVLLVDDNATNLSILKIQTERWGMHPVGFDAPLEALQFLGGKTHIDVAILDFHMPDLNGVQLAERIRKITHRKNLSLLLLSSKEQSAGEAVPDGLFSGILVKPIKEMQLLDTLSSVLSGGVVVTQKTRRRKQPPLAESLPLHILVAEDNDINQKLIMRMLHKLGYDATMAKNGKEAVTYASRSRYDIILMDVNMPEMDGLEATRQILANAPDGEGPTILALTAGVLDEDRRACIEAGMRDLLAKPLHLETLREALETWGEKHISSRTDEVSGTLRNQTISDRIRRLVEEIDGPFVRQLIREYLPEAEKKIARLDGLWGEHNLSAVRDLAHELKGSSSNLGAMVLSSLFEKVQQCVDSETPEPVDETLRQIAEEWPRTKGRLQDAMDRISS